MKLRGPKTHPYFNDNLFTWAAAYRDLAYHRAFPDAFRPVNAGSFVPRGGTFMGQSAISDVPNPGMVSRPRKTPVPRLPKPDGRRMSDFNVNAHPSLAAASASEEMVGKVGQVPFRARMNQACREMTSPDAVSAQNMGLQNPRTNPHGAAVSTTHAPDAGVVAMGAEMARQLPNRETYRNADASRAMDSDAQAVSQRDTLDAAGDAAAAVRSQTSLVHAAPKRRKLFRS